MTAPDLEHARTLLRDLKPGDAAEDVLYARWYHRTADSVHIMPRAGAYLAATLWPARFEDGWTVRRTDLPGLAAAVEVERGSDRRVVAPPDFYPDDPRALQLAPGQGVRINPLTGFASDGFWHLFSPPWRIDGPEDDRQRLYFSVRRGAEVAFVRAFADAAPWDQRWAMKILCGPGLDGRCDTAVAYVPRAPGTASGWVADLIGRVADHVSGDGPPLTRAVRPGIHLAPEIEPDRSFGQLLCTALIDAAGDGAVLSDPGAWRQQAQAALDELMARGDTA